MTAKVALQAGLWYNKLIEIWLSERCYQHPRTWKHLLRRRFMDTLSPHTHESNPTKVCPKCRRSLPATTDFFARHKSNKDGFQYYCKQCRSIAKPRDPVPEGHKQCSRCKEILPETKENFVWKAAYRGRKARFESHCRQCKAQSDKAYASEHKEERKQYRQSRKEQDQQYMITYRQEHSEEIKSVRSSYIAANQEHINQRHRNYLSVYYKTERGQIQRRISTANRRARKRSAVGTHTLEELCQQYDRQKGKCYYCHKHLSKDRASWVEEHIIPLSRGGSNSIDNIVVACRDCNLKKGYKMPHEWTDGGRLL